MTIPGIGYSKRPPYSAPVAAHVKVLDESFWNLIAAACDDGLAVLLLERWARGAGQTSWYLVADRPAIEEAKAAVRPGSEVLGYQDPDLPVVGLAGDPGLWTTAQSLLRETRRPVEVVGLAERDGTPELDADFFTDAQADELNEWLEAVRGRRVWLGKYPARPEGPDALIAVVPDSDGVARAHPR
jgi:hypothetical protein